MMMVFFSLVKLLVMAVYVAAWFCLLVAIVALIIWLVKTIINMIW